MTRATEPDIPMHDPSLGSDPSETDGYARMPRWVKVFGIIALVVVLVFLFRLVTEGPMRPGMHGGGHGQAPPASVVAPNGPDGHNASDWGY